MVGTAKSGAPGCYLDADNGEEEHMCPSSRWEPAGSISQGFSPCVTQHRREDFSLPAPTSWVLIGICAAQLLHILFFNLPLADVFLSVPHSNFLALPLAVTGRRWDMDTRWGCATSEPNLHRVREAAIPPARGRCWAGSAGPHGQRCAADGLSRGWSMGNGLGAHPVPCLSYQIPLSLHSPACKTSSGPPRWCLKAGSPLASSGNGCPLESSIPRL